jgi:transcriptional antiterminator Rof (Rho-off)
MEKHDGGEALGAYIPIGCGDYEMLELACMDGYDVEVHTDAGTIIGHADNLKVRAGEEFFEVRLADGGRDSIRVDRIRRLVVRTRPARFESHTFKRPDVPPVR